MRYRYLLLSLLAFAAPARAQDAIVPVVFNLPGEDWRTKPLGDAIREALSRTPGFNLMKTAVPGALVIAIPDGLAQTGHDQDAVYDFTLVFFRNGERIGQSVESCKAKDVQACAAQIASDAQSAAVVVK